MIIPDLNVVFYASVTSFRHHKRAREWWEATLSASEGVGIVAPVAVGFVRLATGRKVLEMPMTVEQAIGQVESWLGQPNVHFLPDSAGTLARTFDLLKATGAAGNLTTDAQIAAHALERGAVVATNDVDFARFPDVRTMNPLS
jgi:toxin-antitoxin system PIN domain toxin